MSLPTPPSTSHRTKEPRRLPTKLEWATQNDYQFFTASPPRLTISASASRGRPTRSILKQISRVILPDLESLPREETPEPSDPLTDLHYLERPVSLIASAETPLLDLVDAYNTLTTRLRSALPERTEVDSSWPLFQPLRCHRESLVEAISRDLGRVLVDPATIDGSVAEAGCEEKTIVLPPSPKASPSKKRCGMTEEQVKFARDLFSTTQACLRFLSLVLMYPSVYSIFTDAELRTILTDILAIPLADELPTPNSRKTYGMAMLVLQTQRLPQVTLHPARDRIAYALRRGIEGELGKEGKKGAMFDGLKAVHDLVLYLPATFALSFTELLPSVLSALLAPTVALRVQAANALGGLALALTTVPLSSHHSRASAQVAEFLTTAPATKLRSTSSSPGSPSKDSQILRTLRTTLSAADPQHPAQGPAWALCVLASFVVLLHSRVYTEPKVLRIINALLKMTMKHRKSTVRGLGCIVWRAVSWVYFQPSLPMDEVEDEDGGESEVDSEDEIEHAAALEREAEAARERYWDTVASIVEMGTGVATIAALLGDDSESRDEELALRRSLGILRSLVNKGGEACMQALEAVQQMLGPYLVIELAEGEEEPTANQSHEWHTGKLLARGLFSACPGVLTSEYRSLSVVVRPLFLQTAGAEDVRCLTKAELATDWIFDGLLGIWKDAMLALKWPKDSVALSVDMGRFWSGLLSSNMSEDDTPEDVLSRVASRAASVLAELIREPTFCVDTTLPPTDQLVSEVNGESTTPATMLCVKFTVLRDMFEKACQIVPRRHVEAMVVKLFEALVSHPGEIDTTADALNSWASFCGELLVLCEADDVKACCDVIFSSDADEAQWPAETRVNIWRQLVQTWRQHNDATWEGTVVILGVPFSHSTSWEMDSEDFQTWDLLLHHAMDKASDFGHDSTSVLNAVATAIADAQTASTAAPARAADVLMSALEMADAREIPGVLLRFVNDTLLAAYAPGAHDGVGCSWLMRSVSRAIEACPSELVCDLLAAVQEGVSVWLADESRVMGVDDYALNVLPLYEAVIVAVQGLPVSADAVVQTAELLESAFRGRADKPEGVAQIFRDFWEASALEEPEEGWPSAIQNCLRSMEPIAKAVVPEPLPAHDVVAPVAVVAEPTASIDTDDEEPLSFPDSDDEEEETVASTLLAPVSCSPGRLAPAFTVNAGSPSPIKTSKPALPWNSSITATPTRTCHGTPTPSRPRKRSLSQTHESIFPRSMPSPVIPVTPKRTPGSPARSAKSRRADKENESPLPIMSILDRLSARPSVLASPSQLGKRGFADEDSNGNEDLERATKRFRLATGQAIAPSPRVNVALVHIPPVIMPAAKMQAPPSMPTDDTDPFIQRATPSSPKIESSPKTDPGPKVDEGTTQNVTKPLPKKRRRMVLDAVEVPTLHTLQKRVLRSGRTIDTPSVTEMATPTGPSLRRTRSATALNRVKAEVAVKAPSSVPRKPRKTSARRMSSTPVVTVEQEDTSMGDLLETQIIGSDDSIMQEADDQEIELPSSDDDPHLGLVTPRNLVSPAVRRIRDDWDPPSDDSVTASPSREHVARRLERRRSLRSFGKPMPMLFTKS